MLLKAVNKCVIIETVITLSQGSEMVLTVDTA